MAETVRLADGSTVTRFWGGREKGICFEVTGCLDAGGFFVLRPSVAEREALAALILGGDEAPRPRSLLQRAAEALHAARDGRPVTP